MKKILLASVVIISSFVAGPAIADSGVVTHAEYRGITFNQTQQTVERNIGARGHIKSHNIGVYVYGSKFLAGPSMEVDYRGCNGGYVFVDYVMTAPNVWRMGSKDGYTPC